VTNNGVCDTIICFILSNRTCSVSPPCGSSYHSNESSVDLIFVPSRKRAGNDRGRGAKKSLGFCEDLAARDSPF
jgi:hypothetical protein